MVDVCAPFAGVVRWEVAENESVTTGQVIAVVEAVKLEAPVVAPCPGTVTSLATAQFADVEGGQLLAKINPSQNQTHEGE
ncbi:acetyl-CoA carboxylase biotin carboxyl carrier protein subunit [Corynebacterium sp.]|uniref:acetyl-CoA carboxylase biotin carboxyl carrier protein subunit n=1 Tax=Corynebacterium sp. TaxID=1720 RepID=UPI0034A28514